MSVLSRMSLANRSLVALATVAILVLGGLLIPSLKQELYPALDFPALSIITVYPGASPSIVEQDVTNPLEQSIQGIQGIQQITSYSNEGTSIIEVSYDYGTDLIQAQQTLSGRISKVQSSLPSNVTPQLQSYNLSSFPIIQLAVTSAQDEQSLAIALKQNVVPALEAIHGVANVNVTGVRNQIVTVNLDLKKLQAKGLSVSQVQGVLQANNSTLPAGELTSNGQTLSIRVSNTFTSLKDLEDTIVGMQVTTTSLTGLQQAQSASGQTFSASQFSGALAGSSAQPTTVQTTPVKLSDVATVQETLSASTSLTRTNGKPSLGIFITKASDGNTVTISQALRQQIPALERTLGHSASIAIISDQAPSIQSSINGLIKEGVIGAAFAIVIILIFLLSIRSTLVTAISIPLSIIIALIGLWVGNYSLNLFTLGGLTIAIGRVIDDSIVVLENIYRHLASGDKKSTAVLIGVQEVAGAITASTLTTVAVFLPIAFTGGLVGELFKPFSITVTVALLASLFVALTIIPVLAYWFLKGPRNILWHKQEELRQHSILERGYIPLLNWVIKHRAITLIAAFALFFASLALLPHLGTNLFDSSQQNTFTISQQFPVGTGLSKTDQGASQVEAMLKGIAGIQTYQVNVGSQGSLLSPSNGSNQATFSVMTNPNANQAAIQQTVRTQLKALKNAGTLTLSASQGGGFNSSTINVDVQAPDETTLEQAAKMVRDEVANVPDTTDVSSSLANATPLIDVHVDPAKALKHGMTTAQVGQLLRQVYTGTTITTVTLNGTQQDVDLFLGSPANTVQDMKNLLLPTTTGNVKLSDLAYVTQGYGPTQITHINAARTATISATVTGQNVGGVSSDIQRRLNKLKLPAGASFSLGGVSSDQAQTFQNLELAILLAIVFVYLIMVATFRSLLQPLILLVSIPFAATGSIILMLLTHTAIGAPSLIGLLMLVGIVVTNAIVLLDLVHQYRLRGMNTREAVIEGGRRRLRPILMTASATILALIPMALGLDKSSVFIAGPLAIVVIGGLASSTVLTLLLVPTLYTIVEDISDRRKSNASTDSQELRSQLKPSVASIGGGQV